MAFKELLYEIIEGNIARIMMNRPERRNAQDPFLIEEIQDAFIESDLNEDIRVIIFGGIGRDFGSGRDQGSTGMPANGAIIGRALKTRLTGIEGTFKKEDYRDFRQAQIIRNVSKPTIAMVQGNCYAPGNWAMAAMCDLIVASEDARFVDFGARLANVAGAEVLFHPYDIGFRKAKEKMWTGEAVTAQEAKECGMVSRVVPREKLEAETLALAHKIIESPPVAVSLIKRSINQAWDLMGQKSAWEYHFLIHELVHASDEYAKRRKIRDAQLGKGGVKELLKPFKGS
jgi:enoyl-CoA hydratase